MPRCRLAIWVRNLLAPVLLAAHAGPVLAEENPAKAEWAARAGTVAAYLEQTWGAGNGWTASENWQRFPITDVLIDYQHRTGDRQFSAKVAAAVRNRQGLFLNDDDLWAIIASVDAWQTERDPELLAWAATNYSRIVNQHWDDHCGGGLWWDPRHSYKNAITNELLLTASTRLYLATGQDAYRQWALRAWTWFAASGMIGADGLVNDGLDAQCRNNGQPRFTYNQGVVLGGLDDLTAITGETRYRTAATAIALAATRTLITRDGLLTEPFDELGRDGPMFKGVFAFHLGHLVESMADGPERAELQAWLRRNAEAVWQQSSGGTQPVDGLWSGGSGQIGAAAQASGLAMILAARP